ncbi:MAG: hypothetical protein IT319_10230 [Anaerolineae bacterium]|nr:hypothetical protein [Anaerolineae bacterium]
MLPEDSVLVGVINRKRDLTYARDQHWYRIPQVRMPRGVTADYIAFFVSRAFGARNGAIHFYAEKKGLELLYRRDLLPDEPDHPRADEAYYRVALGELIPKEPPVVNVTRRTLTFVYTTWDRFVHARTISDLYSDDDIFVDRLYYALHARGVNVSRTWKAEQRSDEFAPGLHILFDSGATLTASMRRGEGAYFLDRSQGEDAILQAILAEIANNRGTATVSIPPGE